MGTLSPETRAALAELYEEVTSLLLSKIKDPPAEPYRTRYLTRNKLEKMKALIVNATDDAAEEMDVRTSAMLGGIYYLLGTTAMEVEEMSTGEEHLTKCLSLLGEQVTHPDCVVILMATYNQLGILWSMRDDLEKAFENLKQAEDIYDKFKSQTDVEPTHLSVIFTGKKKEDSLFFEKTRTLTLYFLAQVYTKLGDLLKAAQYCHGTLRRQLETDEYDKIDWALNAATMSQFLLEKFAFKQARHHLAAASYILELREIELDCPDEDEQHLADKEQLDHRKADVARCWIKYCIILLATSKRRLMEEDEEARLDFHEPVPQELLELWFGSLDLSDYESKVTYDFVLIFYDARSVFLCAKNWIDQAAAYYTLTEHASDHIAIQQDLSQMYYLLSFFEDDEAKQCKMHKRRADLLTKMVDQISPVHYVQACRELWFELGEIYTLMMDLKPLDSEHHRAKRNLLIKQALESFRSFLRTFKGLERLNVEEAEVPSEFVRPVLLAFIYSGRLHSKTLSTDKAVLIENNRLALAHYQFVVNYSERHPEAKEQMETEIKACRDMISLLPQMPKIVDERSS